VLGCAAAGLAGRESEVMKRAFPFFVAVLSLACAVAFSFKFFDIIGRTLQ
jgi:L-lactate permease